MSEVEETQRASGIIRPFMEQGVAFSVLFPGLGPTPELDPRGRGAGPEDLIS